MMNVSLRPSASGNARRLGALALFAGLTVLLGCPGAGPAPAPPDAGRELGIAKGGAGMASAITMGLAWGLGGLIHTPMTAYYSGTALPQQALYGFVPCLLIASAGAWMLPKTDRESELDESAAAVDPSITAEPHPNPADV